MSEKTKQDTGRDCGHCGGRIVLCRQEMDDVPWSYYECSDCGCKWTVTDELFHIGRFAACPRPSSRPVIELPTLPPLPFDRLPGVVWVILGIVVAALLFPPIGVLLGRFVIYLVSLVRFLVVPLVIAFIVWAGYQLGRRQEWW